MAKIFLIVDSLSFLCATYPAKYPEIIAGIDAEMATLQSTPPKCMYVKKLVRDENGTLRGVKVIANFGFKPNSMSNGKMTPPPPTPKSPDTNPAREPIKINIGIETSSFSPNSPIGIKVVIETKIKNNMNKNPTTLLGIKMETRAPRGANATDEVIIGKAIFGLRNPVRMLWKVTDVVVKTFTRSPADLAYVNGTPMRTSIGIKAIAEPNPHRAKTKETVNETTHISGFIYNTHA